MGVSKNRGKKLPKWMVKIMENPIKMDDSGLPLFLETPKYQMKYQGAQSWCHCWFVRTILDRLEFCSMDGGRRLHRILSFGDLVPIITSHVLFLFLRAMNAPSLLLSTFCFLFGISSDEWIKVNGQDIFTRHRLMWYDVVSAKKSYIYHIYPGSPVDQRKNAL